MGVLLALQGPVGLAILIIMAFLLAIAAEAVVMLLFRLNRFPKCLGDSFMANVGSVLLGILVFLIFNKTEFEGVSEVSELGILCLITIFFEAWIIKLLNTGLSWKKILPCSLVMNLLTFAVMYVYLTTDVGL